MQVQFEGKYNHYHNTSALYAALLANLAQTDVKSTRIRDKLTKLTKYSHTVVLSNCR